MARRGATARPAAPSRRRRRARSRRARPRWPRLRRARRSSAALHWGALVQPAGAATWSWSLLVALAGGAALIALPAPAAPDRQRRAAAGVAGARRCSSLAAARSPACPLRLLGPDRWDELVVGHVGRASARLPAITRALPRHRRVGAHGDPARRDGAAGARRAARPSGRARGATPGYAGRGRGRARHALRGPVIEHGPDAPVPSRRGVLHRCSRALPAGSSACAPTQVGVAAACVRGRRDRRRRSSRRALDGRRPWFDYEHLAEDARSPRRPTAFAWNHSYGPLDWPRDGRELLRIKARRRPTGRRRTSTSFDGRALARTGRAPSRERRHRAAPATAEWVADDQGRRSAACARRSSSPPATCADILPGAARRPMPPERRHVRDLERSRCAAATATRRAVYMPRPTDTPARSAPAPTTRASRVLAARRRCAARPPAALRPATGSRWARGRSFAAVRRRREAARSRGRSGFGVQQDGDAVDRRDSRLRAGIYALAQRSARSADDARTTTSRRVHRPRAARGRPTTRRPPPARLPARRVPVRRPAGLLPAVLRRDGAAAADGRRPGARRRRASAPARYDSERKRVRRARPRRALLGRGVLPALRLGHLRPDAGRLAGARAARRRRRRAPTAARAAGRNSAAPGQSGDRPVAAGDRGAGVAPSGGGGGWQLLVGAARRSPRWRSSAASRCWRRRAPRADARARARRARARAAPHRPRPGRRDVTLARAGARARRRRRGARLPARAARPPLRRRRRRRRRAAQRRALRRELGAGLGLARARCARWWALPPRPPRRGARDRLRRPYTRSRHGQRVRPLPHGTALLEARRLPRRRRAAGARPRPRARQGLGPRGARPRAVRRAALPRGGRRSSGRRRAARRPTTTRCSASAARCSCSGRHAEARHPLALACVPAPGARGLPAYLRPGAPRAQPEQASRAARPQAAAAGTARCYARRHSFRCRPRGRCSSKAGARPLFCCQDGRDR